MDHTLANMMLLPRFEKDIHLTILNETNKIQVATHNMVINKDGYKYLSLLPLSGEAIDVTLSGVKYPLSTALLKRDSSYAVSNEIIDEDCHLSFTEGVILVIQSRD